MGGNANSTEESADQRKAIVTRELQISYQRKVALVLGIVALLSAGGGPIWGVPFLLQLLAAVLATIVVGSPLALWFAFDTARMSVKWILESPHAFGRYRSFFGAVREASPPDAARLLIGTSSVNWALIPVMASSIAWSLTVDYAGLDFGGAPRADMLLGITAAVCLSLGLCYLIDGVVWTWYGRRLLQEQTHIDSFDLMRSLDYRWVWWHGWRRPEGVQRGSGDDSQAVTY